MDKTRFEAWFIEKLLAEIETTECNCDGQRIVPLCEYHSSRSTEQQLLDWLCSHGVLVRETLLKAELVHHVDKLKVTPQGLEYRRVGAIAECKAHVLRMPPCHCELNPIELAWSKFKGFGASENGSFKIAEVEALARLVLERFAAENWAAYESHVIGAEKEMRQKDALIYGTIDRLVILLGEDSESNASDDDSDIGCTPIEL